MSMRCAGLGGAWRLLSAAWGSAAKGINSRLRRAYAYMVHEGPVGRCERGNGTERLEGSDAASQHVAPPQHHNHPGRQQLAMHQQDELQRGAGGGGGREAARQRP